MKLTFRKLLLLVGILSLSSVAPAVISATELDTVHLQTVNLTNNTIDVYMTPDTPINAVYLHLSYDTKKYVCTTMQINEKQFPLILESSIDATGDIMFAIAQPGYGTATTTLIATFKCSSNTVIFELQNDSKAYLADGEGTEINIIALKNTK